MRVQRARDEHDPRRVLVQPMHEARARDRPQPRIVCEQTVEERSVAIARAGVNHEPGGFVEDQQVRVVVEDGKRPRLGDGPVIVFDGTDDADPFTTRDAIPDPHRRTVEGRGAGADPSLDSSAGVLWEERRERPVGSRTGEHVGYDAVESEGRRHRPAHEVASRGFRIPERSGPGEPAETRRLYAAVVAPEIRARNPARLRS